MKIVHISDIHCSIIPEFLPGTLYTAIEEINKIRPDLVLAGHRHRPWKYNLNGMKIIHAGSVSCLRLRGFFRNSYNIINIRGKKITAKLKIVGGDELDFEEVLKIN
jgi:predicted phosphodiesterase